MDGKIYIPKPCHENWNKMSLEEKGRHCAVCSKVVKDFTNIKKNEIIDVLKATEGEICGRINVKEVTPTNKKQKIYFLVNGWLYRKAIYPIMALMGITLVAKKATAQVDYPLKGKVAYNEFHVNSKKVTVIVKSKTGNKPVANAIINVVGGVRTAPESQLTDTTGKAILDLKANNLMGEAIDIEINALEFEYKKVTIKLVKDVQTVEITMEEELIMMGKMLYVPEKVGKIVQRPLEVDKRDSSEKIKIIQSGFLEVIKLPLIREQIEYYEFINAEIPGEAIDGNTTTTDPFYRQLIESKFEIYPNPAADFVNITTTEIENFNLDVFDEHGKKLQSVMNGNGRYSLDVSDYSNGMYYVLIMVGGRSVETKKIIVTR